MPITMSLGISKSETTSNPLLPEVHYGNTAALATIIRGLMGSSDDPDKFYQREKTPTQKELANRNANVAARVDGSVN